MIIDPTDVLELVFTNAKTNLQESHAKLVASHPEIRAVACGHSLTATRRAEIILTLERWDEERLWFTSDGRGGVSLESVCDAAGTTVGLVREFYQEWLTVPFNFRLAYSWLIWEHESAGENCRVCASGRCEALQASFYDEGGAAR